MMDYEWIQSYKLTPNWPKLVWNLTIWPNFNKSKLQMGLCLQIKDVVRNIKKVIDLLDYQILKKSYFRYVSNSPFNLSTTKENPPIPNRRLERLT